MGLYRLESNGVYQTVKKLSIPNDPSNSDWQEYLDWVGEGNTADPQYTLQERRDIRWVEAVAICEDKKDGGVIENSITFSTNCDKMNELGNFILGVDKGYAGFSGYWMDTNDDVVSVTITNLNSLIAGYAELVDKCQENAGNLHTTIMASSDPESVDITAGYPTVPYTPA